MDQESPELSFPPRTYHRQSIVPNPASEVHRLSVVQGNVQFTPFKAHASLSRVKSDDPWGIKQATGVHPYPQTIDEESDDQAGGTQSARSSQHVNTVTKTTTESRTQSPNGPAPATEAIITRAIDDPTNCCTNGCRRVNVDWLFFIRPIGILMVLEIGIGSIAVVCSDFGEIFQAAWKTWFIMWNLIIITLTGTLFLLHLCRFGRGDTRTKLIFLLSEVIYDVFAALSLLLSAVAYLRVSMDPNTYRSYSQSVVIIAGVCGVVASVMYGISGFLAFNVRRTVKYLSGHPSRHRSTTMDIDGKTMEEDDDDDDEEFEHFTSAAAAAAMRKKSIAPPPLHSKRIARNPNTAVKCDQQENEVHLLPRQ